MTEITNKVEVIKPVSPRYQPELFKDDGVAFDVWLPQAIEDPELYVRADSPTGVAFLLTDLMAASRNGAPNWQRYRKHTESEDMYNFYSAPFEIPISRDPVNYRLNMRLPFGQYKQAMVDLEVRTQDPYDRDQQVTYGGQHARWTPDEAGLEIIGLQGYPERGDLQVLKPYGEMSTFWDRFIKAAVSAHAKFCPTQPD